MPNPQPLNVTSKQIVMDMINAANGVGLTLGNFEHGNPIANPIDAIKNTDLLIWKTGAVDADKKYVHYDRVDLGAVFGVDIYDVPEYPHEDIATVGDILALINAEFAMALDDSDIETSTVVPAGGPYPRSVILTVKATSLAYIGVFSVDLTDPA